jgi:hypothetical protein
MPMEGRQGASSAVQITDRYHLVSNLTEAVERDVQQLQIDGRKQSKRGDLHTLRLYATNGVQIRPRFTNGRCKTATPKICSLIERRTILLQLGKLRWRTHQQYSRRNNTRLEWEGENLTVAGWSRKRGIGRTTLSARHKGWSVAEVSGFVVGLQNSPADSPIRLEVLPATIFQDAGNAPLDDVEVLQVNVVTRQRVGVVESQPAAAKLHPVREGCPESVCVHRVFKINSLAGRIALDHLGCQIEFLLSVHKNFLALRIGAKPKAVHGNRRMG